MRIRTRFKRAATAIALAAAAQAAIALDIGLAGSTGNLQYPWDQTTPSTKDAFPASNYFWGGEAWLSAPLGEDASVRLSYERDPVLRNSAIAAVQFERGIAKISVGPLFGFLNSDSSAFSAGISASVRLQWPGVAYVSMRSDGGTAISILQADADPQARTELAAGFYVPNAIVSGLVSAKRFNELDSDDKLVTDSLTRYAMTIDVFKKNVPYTALFSIGYELRSKRYEASDTTDSLGAVMLGLDASAQIDPALKLLGSFSTGAYVFGLDDLKDRGPDTSTFLFSANLGLSIDLAAIKFPPKAERRMAKDESVEKPQAVAPAAPVEQPIVKEEPKDEPQAEAGVKHGLSISTAAGLYYDSYPLSGSILDVLNAITNLRAGLWADCLLPIKGGLEAGGELGVFYMTVTEDTTNTSISVLDIPLRAKLSYKIGKLGLEAFAGLFTSSIIASTYSVGLGIDAGGRIKLGGLYAEGDYVFGLGDQESLPRFGLGDAIKL
jgi:hypothetical protein